MWCVRKLLFRNHVLLNQRFLNSKIPSEPFQPPKQSNNCATNINKETIAHLERLSLVDFGNEKGIKILEDAILFADQIASVNTKGVEPLISVLEASELRLREDVVNDGNCRKEVLSNAAITEEDYFVAPPGNIPVTPKTYLDYTTASDNSSDESEVVNKKLSVKEH